MPVHNAGVPGFSTHQGRQALEAALAVRPRAVLLAYLVRDAQAAAIPDAARPASTAPPDLQLLRLLRSIRPRPAPPAGGPTTRVPPEAYEANLLAMIAAVRAAGAVPLLLAFPMRTPATAHLAVLRALDARADGAPLLEPAMPPDSWFEEDPIHLTPDGNAHLAEQLGAEVPSHIAPRPQALPPR
jgi:lysophospholipase L1-like esterase